MYLKSIKKLVKKYTIHLIIIFLLANTSIALLIFTNAQNSNCMNQAQIDADPRCLYVYQNEVYEMGSRSKPHKGHQCGMNVDSIMPNLHFTGKILSKFNSARIAPFCESQQSPTDTPTQVPTQTPTSNPTVNPTATTTANPTATAATTTIPTQTALPTTTPIQNQTTTPIPKTATPTQSPSQTSQATNLPTPTQTSISYTGNTFGEILGKPEIATVTPSPIAKNETKFNLTKISKPVSYISLLGFIGSIVLILIF